MSVRLRLLGAAIGLLLPAVVLVRWTLAVVSADLGGASITLPRDLGTWVAGEEETLEDWVLEKIEPDAYLMRRYDAEGGAPVWIFVSLYARWSGFGREPHSPEGCYPAGGWEIMRRQPVDVPVAGGEGLVADLLEVQQAGQEQTVLYWFQPPGRWPRGGGGEQLRRAFDSVVGRPQFAFVRLSTATATPAEAARLIELAGLLATPVRASVDRLREAPDFGSLGSGFRNVERDALAYRLEKRRRLER